MFIGGPHYCQGPALVMCNKIIGRDIEYILIHSKFLVDRQRRKSELDSKANLRKSVTFGARWIMVDGLVKKMVVDGLVNRKTLVDVTEEVDSAVCEV